MSNYIKSIGCSECKAIGKDTAEDNLAIYSDGSAHCHACGYDDQSKQYAKLLNGLNKIELSKNKEPFLSGEYADIPERGLKKSVCEFFDYKVGRDWKGSTIHIANFYKDHELVSQQIRNIEPKKSFYFKNAIDNMPLWGQDKWVPNENLFITITEGMIDTLSVAQVEDCKFPVVSLTHGIKNAENDLRNNLQWLLQFKYVVLCFDNESEPEKRKIQEEFTQRCILLFDPHKVRVARLPLKDANDMLVGGRGEELRKCIMFAKEIKPDNLVTISDIIEDVVIQPQWGASQPWIGLDNMTYGLRMGEIYVIVGANGIGKSEFVMKILSHFIADMNVGVFSFEYSMPSFIQRLVSTKLKNKSYLPGQPFDSEQMRHEAMQYEGKIWMNKRVGGIEINELFNSMRYLVLAKNIKVFIIDNVKGLGLGTDKEKSEDFMRRLQAFKIELQCTIILLSHVAKDKMVRQAYVSTSPKNAQYAEQNAQDVSKLLNKPGMDWENGRMPSKENVEGLSVICDLADNVLALGRNTVSEDDTEARTLRVKMLKCRLDSKFTGNIIKLYYNEQGEYIELNPPNSNRSI